MLSAPRMVTPAPAPSFEKNAAAVRAVRVAGMKRLGRLLALGLICLGLAQLVGGTGMASGSDPRID